MADQNGLTAFNPGATTPQTNPSTPQGVRKLADNVALTNFNDESVRQYEFDLYSGKTNQIDRIYILNVSDIVKARVHYHDKLKGGILCQSRYEKNAQGTQENLVTEAFCCRLLGAAGPRFAALIIKYGTDVRGQITQPFSFEQRLWKFGPDKFAQLRNVNKDWPLQNHDLSVSCTDEQYQKMQIGAKPEAIFMNPQFPGPVKAGVLEWAKASVSKMPRELGKTLTEQELMTMMQQAQILTVPGNAPQFTGGAQAGDSPIANFGDILTGVGGAANPTPGVIEGTAVPTPGS